ncbi:G-protein coupled receptor-like protein [Leptotrombidium deliense]|uniref:G-protein coupled receptor-like protein n=1 Tax=Leptotrombidium deliense TaxID=299467 RepID=A0A443SBM3_9ACAR|nr:G-protein coupled receptor-like protein [Leptotrombidium deliense]
MMIFDNQSESHINGIEDYDIADSQRLTLFKKPIYSLLFLICVEVIIVAKNKAFGNKSTTNYFIYSLAVSDLIVGVMVMPTGIICFITDDWIFGQLWCEIWQTFDLFSCTASILNLCAISLDRYWAISEPLNYTIKMKKTYVTLLILSIWVVSAFVTLPPMIWNRILQQNSCDPHSCECHSLAVHPPYVIFLTTTTFFIPLVLMSFVNYRTYRIAVKQIYAIYSENSPKKTSVPLRHITSVEKQKASKKRSRSLQIIQKQFKVTKTLGIVMGCFVVCWMPYFLVYSLDSFCKPCIKNSNTVIPITLWLGWLNSGMNPIIYTCLSKKFRKSAALLLMCKSQQTPLAITN